MRAGLIPVLLVITACLPARAAYQWTRLTSPNFELYTDATQKEGRDLLVRFEQVHSFFQKAAPVRAPEEFPVRIIAFRQRDEFQSYAQTQTAAAFFTSNAYRDYIVLSNPSQEAFSIGVHEYTHLAIRHSGLRLPLWLNEGWADVFSSMRNVSGGIAVGDLLKERVSLLEKGEWMDLDALASVNPNSPEYHEPNRVGLFYSESWALAHMLYLAPDYRNNFAKFLKALNGGLAFSQAAESSFGKTSGEVFTDLKAYLGRKKLTGQIFEVALDKSAVKPEIAAVNEFDAQLMLADLRAITGEVARAAEEYEILRKEQPDRPEIALSLGYLALARRDKAAARQEFEKAFTAGINDLRMLFQLAALEREEKAPASKLIPILERAVALRPGFTDAAVNLGLLRLETRDYERTLELLTKVDTINPSSAPAVYTALAYANLQTGHLEEARRDAAVVRKYAKDAAQTDAVTGIEGLIDARAKSKFPPKPGEKLQQAEGLAQSMECGAAGSRLTVLIAGQPKVFELPEPKAVEFNRPQGTAAQLSCSIREPFPIVVEFASPNVVRRLQF